MRVGAIDAKYVIMPPVPIRLAVAAGMAPMLTLPVIPLGKGSEVTELCKPNSGMPDAADMEAAVMAAAAAAADAVVAAVVPLLLAVTPVAVAVGTDMSSPGGSGGKGGWVACVPSVAVAPGRPYSKLAVEANCDTTPVTD